MLNSFKSAWGLIRDNLAAVVWFEAQFALLLWAAIAAWQAGFSAAAFAATRQSYVSNDNLAVFLRNPVVWAMLAVTLLGAAYFAFVQVAAFSRLFLAARNGGEITLSAMWRFGLKRAAGILLPKNLAFVLYVLLPLPVLLAAGLIGLVPTFKLPDFIHGFVWGSPALVAGVLALAVFCAGLLFAGMFAPLLFAGCGQDFAAAVRQGLRRLKKGFWTALIKLPLWNLLLLAAAAGAYLAAIFVSAAGVTAVLGERAAFAGLMTLIWTLNAAAAIAFALFAPPYNLAMLVTLFDASDPNPQGGFVPRLIRGQRRRTGARVTALAALPLAVGLNLISLAEFSRKYPAYSILERPPLIAAHRGDSRSAPENTLTGIRRAVENLADCVEIDVQQTKDGVPVLCHDPTLKRTTGVDRSVWDMTYAEIARLEAGSWFSPEFSGEPVPTLEQALRYARFRVKLNVELKYEDKSPSLVPAAVALIQKYRMQEDCFVSSFRRETILEVKRLEPRIATVYLSAIAWGDIDGFPQADVFSLEASAASPRLAARIKGRGKRLHVWTVNTEDALLRAARLFADMVVTDDPVLARQVLYFARNDFWSRLFSEIFG